MLAVIVGLVAGGGALTLTDSRSTEEHPDEELEEQLRQLTTPS